MKILARKLMEISLGGMRAHNIKRWDSQRMIQLLFFWIDLNQFDVFSLK